MKLCTFILYELVWSNIINITGLITTTLQKQSYLFHSNELEVCFKCGFRLNLNFAFIFKYEIWEKCTLTIFYNDVSFEPLQFTKNFSHVCFRH
jgi:hypothetical protein